MVVTTDQRTASTYLAAMALTTIVAAGAHMLDGYSLASLDLALRATGRVAFLVLIAVFVARPLQMLLRKSWTAQLLRRRRQLGVTFAGIHTGHLGLILYKVNLVPDLTLQGTVNVPAAVIYGAMLAMLITSFEGPARAIGPKAWKVLHKIGLYVLFLPFLQSQLPKRLDQLETVNAVLIGLAALAIAVRVAAFLRRSRR